MTSTHARLFGGGNGELNVREFFGRGFARSRSPSPIVEKSNPIAWDATGGGTVKRTSTQRKSEPGPYAYAPPPRTSDATTSSSSFLGSRKKRISEPTPTTAVGRVRALLSPAVNIREPDHVASLKQVADTSGAKPITGTRFTSPRPGGLQSPATSPRSGVTAAPVNVRSRKNFPDKRTTCGVNLGLRHGPETARPWSPLADKRTGQRDAFDMPFSRAGSPRARFFATDSASFISRKKKFEEHTTPNSVQNLMYQQSNAQDAASATKMANSHLAVGSFECFTSPHKVGRKGEVSGRGDRFAKPGRLSDFPSNDNPEFWKESKHMMKRMYHNDPTKMARDSIQKGLGIIESQSASKATISSRINGRAGGGICERENDFMQPTITEKISNTLRAREQAHATRKYVWKP